MGRTAPHTPRADPLISYLVVGMRAHGVAVSPAEVLDAHRALKVIGVHRRLSCVAALRATLVKQAAHDRVFDALLAALDAAELAGLEPWSVPVPDASEMVEYGGVVADAPTLPPEAERIRVSDGGDDATEGDLGDADPDSASPVQSIGVEGVELADAGSESDADRHGHRIVVRVRSSTEYELTWADRSEVERAARVFLRAHRHDARRWGPAKRGRIDVRRTMRGVRRTGGVPMTLHRRGRVRRGPHVVVLADVSISVRPTAILALHAADALTRRARGVRLYAFVDRAVDATAIVRRLPPGAAVAELVDGGVVDVSAASDYGTALRTAHDQIGSRLDRATTVVVFGDGRSNGADPGFDVLDRWQRTVRSVVWCTPEPIGAWPLGFGEMQGYADRASAAHTVRSVDDLVAALTE